MPPLLPVSTVNSSQLPSLPILVDGDEGITITFNDGNGLLKLHQQGYFDKGRRVHVTGSIAGISEVYEKDGELHIRKRPQLTLDSQVLSK